MISEVFGPKYCFLHKRSKPRLNPLAQAFQPVAAVAELQPWEATPPVPQELPRTWYAEQEAERLHPDILSSVQTELENQGSAVVETPLVSREIIKFIGQRTSRRAGAQHHTNEAATEASEATGDQVQKAAADTAAAATSSAPTTPALNPAAQDFIPLSSLTLPKSLNSPESESKGSLTPDSEGVSTSNDESGSSSEIDARAGKPGRQAKDG